MMNILVVVKTGDFLINDMLDMQTMSPCRALLPTISVLCHNFLVFPKSVN